MFRQTTLLVASMLASGCATLQAPDDWSRADRNRQIAYSVALAADVALTSEIQHHDNLVEGNPITNSLVGDNPSDGEALAYGIGAGLLNYWIATKVPKRWRRHWHYGTLALQTHAIAQNCDNELC